MSRSFRPLTMLALVAAPALLSACAVGINPVTGRQRAFAFTWQEEIALGRQADVEIVREYGIHDDPRLTEYIRRVGEAILAQSHLRREGTLPEFRETPFTWRVLDTEMVNAFALPGGFVYVTRGLLAHTQNEAQLAVVLGHEVAHVAARHSSQDALKATIGLAGVLGLSLLAEELGGVGDEVSAVGGVAASLLLFRYSRDQERESDRLGVEYAARAGYRAEEGAGFFQLLRRMDGNDGWSPTFLSTHPDPGRREDAVRTLAAEWVVRGFPSQQVEEAAFLAAIEGMPLGPNLRQGYIEGNTFHHPEGRFRFGMPRGWQTEMEGRTLQMVRGDDMGIFFIPTSRRTSGSDAAAELVKEYELRGVRQVVSTVNGFRAHMLEGTAGEQDSGTRVRAYFVEQDGVVRSFVGYAPPERADEMRGVVESVMRSFRRETDPGVLNVRLPRLQVVTVQRSAPFRTLLPDPLPRGITVRDMALMNHVEPGDMIPAGAGIRLLR
jgi:predicted Zn-dependent protease